MDDVTGRALRDRSGEIGRRVQAGEGFVITRRGKPSAWRVPTEPQAMGHRRRAIRRSRRAGPVRHIPAAAKAQA